MQDKKIEKQFWDGIASSDLHWEGWNEGHYNEILDRLNYDFKGKKLLEAGCGYGDWGTRITKRGAKVVGVDISPISIQKNKQLNKNIDGYSAMVGDLEESNLFDKKSLDGVACFFVLHHFPNLDTVGKNFSEWLKQDGSVLVVEPNG